MTLKKRGILFFAITLAVILLATDTTSSWAESGKSTGTVCFTKNEADSVLTALDRQSVSIRLARIRIEELEHTVSGQQSDIQALRAKIDPWYKKLLKHPALWFCIGAYAGMKAAE